MQNQATRSVCPSNDIGMQGLSGAGSGHLETYLLDTSRYLIPGIVRSWRALSQPFSVHFWEAQTPEDPESCVQQLSAASIRSLVSSPPPCHFTTCTSRFMLAPGSFPSSFFYTFVTFINHNFPCFLQINFSDFYQNVTDDLFHATRLNLR